MSGWSILIRGVVCSFGVVYFLRLVTHAIADSREMLQAIEEHEETLRKQRVEAGIYLASSAASGERGQWSEALPA